MPSPTITPSPLFTLGASAAALGAHASVQPVRDALPGAFARELHKLQDQARTVSPPPPAQPASPPPAQPPAPTARGPANGPSNADTGSNPPEPSAPGPAGPADNARAQGAPSGSEGPARPTEPTSDRPRPTRRASRTDLDAREARAPHAGSAGSDSNDTGAAGRAGHAHPSERVARRRTWEAEAAADMPATVSAQPVTALPSAGPAQPARSALPVSADPALQGPQADDRTARNTPLAPRVPGIDELSGRAQTLAADVGESAGSAAASPRPPQRPATAGDTVPSLSVDGRADPGARPSDAPMAAEPTAVIAGRQDNALALQQASTTGPQPALPSFAAELARASGNHPAGASATPAPPPAERTLPTPVTAPDFLPRLGGELAVLARDGVQEARINVHPAELGPISVQIALDGTAAKVHLAVDNAQTRELLEQAMPTLAAALHDTGLTLTGGGVFQQSRQAPQGQPAADARNGALGRARGDDPDADPARLDAAIQRRLRPLGALDVFA
ncbi:MAG: putative flagellar hook-length control protein FilK [Pseudomonadota bacterium]|jgi:flagellar hook-length control protein FliK